MASPWLRIVAVLVGYALMGCGGDSNFNQIWGTDDGADTLLAEAKVAYDRGDFADAEGKLNTLIERNPDNEEAAVLLGYVALSQGGIDPYRLARSLINLDDAEGDKNSGGKSEAEKSTEAVRVLQSLGSLINLSEPDFLALAQEVFNNGGAPTQLFNPESNKILVPAKVNDDLRVKVHTLKMMNKAVRAVCRFVASSTKSDDARHGAGSCAEAGGTRRNQAKAHFLWGFAHLTEALIYQSVLLYQEAGKSETNFQQGANVINTFQGSGIEGITSFTALVTEMNAAVDAVFNSDDPESMLRATLLNLQTVDMAFSAIAGLPDSLRARIANVLRKIEEAGKAFGGGLDGNTKALRGQLTEKFAETVGKKIASALESYKADIAQKTGVTIETYEQLQQLPDTAGVDKQQALNDVQAVCTSYDQLMGSLAAEKQSKPGLCPL